MHGRPLFLRKHIMIIHGMGGNGALLKKGSVKRRYTGGTIKQKPFNGDIPVVRLLSVRIHIYGGCSQAKSCGSFLPESPCKYGIRFKQAVYLRSGQVSGGSQHVH